MLSLNKKCVRVALLAVLALVACSAASGQNEDPSPSAESTQSPDMNQQPNSTTEGQSPDAQEPPYRLNPPIVGMKNAAGPSGTEDRSYLIPGAQLSAGVDTVEPDGFGHSSAYGVSHGLGSLSLQKLWRRYDLDVDYLGGAAYLGARRLDHAFLQVMDGEQHVSWRTGQFGVRDSFTYLPEGNFGGGSYGGIAALSALYNGNGLLGLGIFGAGQFATLGEESRITNVALADVTQFLSPRSSVFAAGSYGLVHFSDSKLNLINSQQVVTEGAYDYQLNRRDQVALLYAYQSFRFPNAQDESLFTDTATARPSVETNLANVVFGHRVSGRMDLIAGGGPQITDIDSPLLGRVHRLTMSGRASLKYQLRTTQLNAQFFRYNTNGSGFFAGATTNLARFSVARPFGRVWNGEFDLGYTHNRALVNFVGTHAESFNYGYIGGGLHRQLSREFSAFVSYQFGTLNFNNTFCLTASACGRTSQREVALVGLDWHPHPIPLD